VKQSPQQLKSAFPWVALGFLALGYAPVGVILGYNNLAVTVTVAGVWARAKDSWAWIISLSLLGALLGEIILSWFNDFGIWTIFVYGVCGFVQFWFLLLSLGLVGEALDGRYRPVARFFILGIVSSLGLLLGGGLGGWLASAEVVLPL
jgi:hypothetical protein